MRSFLRMVVALASVLAAVATAQDFRPPMPMDGYVLGLLRRGPTWTASRTPQTDSIQAGHMANIGRMADEGVLLGAGPMLDRGELRGIFIFRSDSLAKLRALADRDPAIQSQRLALDLYPWFAPAGLGKPYFARWKQPGFRDSMVRYQLALLRRTTKERPAGIDSIQIAHLRSVFGLLLSGKAATAGPVGEGPGDLAGVLVLRGDSAAAAAIVAADPAVKTGRFRVDLHPWIAAYGVMPGDTL